MVMITKTVKVKWNGNTRKHYEKLGYIYTKHGNEFEVDVNDLQKTSCVIVQVKCDYCGEIHDKKYRNYTKNKDKVNKDCCSNPNCKSAKGRDVMYIIYGVDNYTKTEKSKQESSVRNKTPKEDILKIANDKNIEILNIDDYENEKTRLEIICHNHKDYGIQETNFLNIKRNQKCCFYGGNEIIGDKLRLSEQEVFNYFKSRGLIVEDGERYVIKDGQIKCRCIHHPEHLLSKTLNCLENTKEPCEYCRNEKSLSDLSKILRSSVTTWKRLSEQNCEYKCIFTGSNDYEVHHLYSFNSIIKDCIKELDININDYSAEDIINIKTLCIKKHEKLLGVCLRVDIHTLYHKLYDNDNTPDQFEEFSYRYKIGEFDEILNNEVINK